MSQVFDIFKRKIHVGDIVMRAHSKEGTQIGKVTTIGYNRVYMKFYTGLDDSKTTKEIVHHIFNNAPTTEGWCENYTAGYKLLIIKKNKDVNT